MNSLRDINYINKLLIDINNCDDIDKFYELCTKLYYIINSIVFHFEDKLLTSEEKEEKE